MIPVSLACAVLAPLCILLLRRCWQQEDEIEQLQRRVYALEFHLDVQAQYVEDLEAENRRLVRRLGCGPFHGVN